MELSDILTKGELGKIFKLRQIILFFELLYRNWKNTNPWVDTNSQRYYQVTGMGWT